MDKNLKLNIFFAMIFNITVIQILYFYMNIRKKTE